MLRGIYKEPSYNQRTFCMDVQPPDYIKTWFEEPNGEPQDHWWDVEITPQKFHWLVGEWNNGNIAKVYPHWWEKVDTRNKHINSLLQLRNEDLTEVLNYFCMVMPHYRWTTELHMDDDLRPLYNKGKIIRFENVSKDVAIEHNKQERANKKYRADMELYGRSDRECLEDVLNETDM